MSDTVDPFASLPPIFRDCAARRPTSRNADTPWVDGGYVYATDGHIAVRMPVAGLTLLPEWSAPVSRVENPGSLFVKAAAVPMQTVPLPAGK